jgi:nucleoside-diphosphate-sugar epimerase
LDLARRGWRVRALARGAPDAGLWGDARPQIERGDLADGAALERLASGADVVIHVAGLIKAQDRDAFMLVNETGAARMATAARAVGAPMVLISSLAAREPALSDYAASKAAGEAAARAAYGGPLTILRPPAVYGPGDTETLALFRLAARAPILPMPGDTAARLALAHVADVGAQIVQLAERPTPGTWTVAGAKAGGYGWREIFLTAAGVMGRRPSLLPLPAWALGAAGWVSDQAAAATGKPAIFGAGKVRELLHPDWSVSAEEQLPGAPPARFDLASGFNDAVTWYRAHRLL